MAQDKSEQPNLDYHWWQTGVVYQIYPRSFQDSNDDGIGDLTGIIQRLDYLGDTLGVDAIWISPIYPSPMHDFGYDVSDYCDIHPMFGSMADFDHLLDEIHQRDMKLILDLVPNHTSDEHPWFIESKSSRDNPRHDWYIWRDPAPNGGPPNNWMSHFGGTAWTFDEKIGQYYLHQFARQQPELNYRNPDVVAALYKTMHFWLKKGVDGFRVDTIGLMMKDPFFRDEPINPGYDGRQDLNRLQHIHTVDLPEVHELIHEMRLILDSYDDRMMVGETFLPNAALMKYYGTPEKKECHIQFNFQLIDVPWDALKIRKLVDDYELGLPVHAWPNWVLGNHDQHRAATRVGPAQARAANMLLLTLRGTPTCYYGDEIGMQDVPIPADMIQDPPAVNQPDLADIVGRDPERTPMQWDDSPNAGFSAPGVKTWLPLGTDFAEMNVACESRDPHSFLAFFKKLLACRKSSPALTYGDYRSVDIQPAETREKVFVFERHTADERMLVALNFSGDDLELELPYAGTGEIVLSTDMTRAGSESLANFSLRANQGCIIRLPG